MRKAWLDPRYAQLYPMVAPGKWIRASVLAHPILKISRVSPAPGTEPGARVLKDEHFSFLGCSRRYVRYGSCGFDPNTRETPTTTRVSA